MATYGADDLQNLWHNLIPTSLTVTPWQCYLAKAIYRDTGDPKMKSFAGPQGWNTWIINKMHKAYLEQKDILSTANVSYAVKESFLKNLPLYQGADVREGVAAAAIDLVTDTAEGAGESAKTAPTILIILAIGVTGYLIYAGRKGTKLTPF